MSRPVSTSYSDDDLDVLDALAYLEGVRGHKRSAMQREIVQERLRHVLAHDPQVRKLVAARRAARAEQTGQGRLRIIEGGRS